MLLEQLQNKISNSDATIGVVGLGYVGLPVACVMAQAGYRVIGVDIKSDRVAMINSGHSPIKGDEPGLEELLSKVVRGGYFRATTDYMELAAADVVLLNVETPVDENHQPQYVALRAACRGLGQVMKEGVLVIVESTVAPGTVDKMVRSLLEETSGLKLNQGFYLAACPERITPGRLLNNLYNMSRVCGGSTPETAEVVASLYRRFVRADLDTSDIITAELVKTAENTYRDVQIAFANEVALICEANGADVWRVRELVNKAPYRQMHMPGAGVGGHCIPKDPWLLVYSVANSGLPLRLIPAARAVNDQMPAHVVSLVEGALHAAGMHLHGARIAVLGYAYLEDSDDTRNSPSEALAQQLRNRGAEVTIHDPFVPEYQGDVMKAARDTDGVVIMVRHRAYRTLDLAALKAVMRTPVLVDGRRVVAPDEARAAGLLYRAIGQGAHYHPVHSELWA